MFLNCKQVEFGYVPTSFKANQLLTGYGNTSAYLHCFRLRKTDGSCRCGLGPEKENQIRCECMLEPRTMARRTIVNQYGNLDIRLRMDGSVEEYEVRKANLASRVIEDEDFGNRGGRKRTTWTRKRTAINRHN